MNNNSTISDVKKYWDNRPCNIRHSDLPFGSKEYFDAVEARKYFVEPHIPGFADFEKWQGKNVLEVGCGIGTDAVNFARAGAKYSSIELSTESIDITKRRFDVFNLNGQFVNDNAEHLSAHFKSQKFDLVYSFGVIHHTPSPEKIISEVRKVIADDGEFRLMLYAKNSWKAYMIEAGLDQPEAQFGCPIAYTYDEDDVKDLLKGFDVLEITQQHIFPYKIEKYVKYEYEKEDWFSAMPAEMFEILERKLGWHMLIRAKPG